MKQIKPLITSFAVLLTASTAPAALVGLWEFDDSGDLGKATVGTDLTIKGTAPTYSASKTDGGAVTLNGVIATTQGTNNYLLATHGIGANGGGSKTNQYTLVYDVKRAANNKWRSFYQTTIANNNDGEFFTRGGGGVVNSLGRAASGPGYTSAAMAADTWMRIVISVDLGNSFTVYYNNGTSESLNSLSVDHGSYSLNTSQVLLFADNDNENVTMDIGMVAIYDTALNASEVAALGPVGTAVPEPSSAALLGLGGLALILRRRKA